jgi:uncharacterized protein (TIGR02246 family)
MLTRLTLGASLAVIACATPEPQDSSTLPADTATIEASLLALSDSTFAAARSLDADGFARHFSGRADLVYLINTRQLGPRDSVRAAFARLLSEHQRFEPTWGTRHVQVLSASIGVVTAEFETVAQEHAGEQWAARGVVTFVAVREPTGWRVVNWHTTE